MIGRVGSKQPKMLLRIFFLCAPNVNRESGGRFVAAAQGFLKLCPHFVCEELM
jgi:hypothetical protein